MRVSALTIAQTDLAAKPIAKFTISSYGPLDEKVQYNRFGKQLWEMKELIKKYVAANAGTEDEKRVCLAIAMQVCCGTGLMAFCFAHPLMYIWGAAASRQHIMWICTSTGAGEGNSCSAE